MTRAWSRAGRGRVIALLVLALVVRAFVPSGWMPVATPDGLTFALCPSQGDMPVMAMHHDGSRHDGQALPDHPCAFAGVGLAADTVPPPLVVPVPPVAAAYRATALQAVAVGRGLAAPPPPATGPPAFA